MRKKYETIQYKNVNGNSTHIFTLKKPVSEMPDKIPAVWDGVGTYEYYSIWDAYKTPSYDKEKIWNEWYSVCNGRCCVSSCNGFFFTVRGVAKLQNLETGEIIDKYIYITHANNYVYETED